MKRPTWVLLASLLASGIAIAGTKDPASWDNLKQLRAGDKIEVIDQSLKSFRGNFACVSDEAISLQSKKESFTIERANVLRVSARNSAKRNRNMLIGAAIGAGAALAIALPVDAVASSSGNSNPGLVAGVTAAAAGAGLGVGATTGNRVVYRATKAKP